jgi:hypothetical protein
MPAVLPRRLTSAALLLPSPQRERERKRERERERVRERERLMHDRSSTASSLASAAPLPRILFSRTTIYVFAY